jgi:hypothetical protein
MTARDGRAETPKPIGFKSAKQEDFNLILKGEFE